MIELDEASLAVVRRILAEMAPDCEAFAFGSRVNGKPKPYSDLDIALRAPGRLPVQRIAAIKEAFEESDLTIRVDLVDWHALTPAFRDIVDAEAERVPAPATG